MARLPGASPACVRVLAASPSGNTVSHSTAPIYLFSRPCSRVNAPQKGQPLGSQPS